VPVDFYTCEAVFNWASHDLDNKITTSGVTVAHSLHCASHNCSCSVPPLPDSTQSDIAIYNSLTSTITIDGKFWEIPAPPLDVALVCSTYGNGIEFESTVGKSLDETWQNASDIWANSTCISYAGFLSSFNDTGQLTSNNWYMYDETIFDFHAVLQNGVCVADEAYSWGFSSLLLLTFCCYTIAFALALIILETDVYWNSRHDRDHQSHSIYTDVLYLAEELKNTFGHNIEDHMQSPKAFERRVERWKQGLRLDIRELPISRWQERRLSRATKRADRKAKTAPTNATEPKVELRNMSSRNHGGSAASDTTYHGLIGRDDGESGFEAGSRSDRRSTSGELAPSFAGMQTSTEGSVHDGTVLEGTVADSSLLGGDVSREADPGRWDLQDRSPRTG
jgi:hypothetical protein